MDAPDMMDVLHYMFEDDIVITSKEEAESKDRVRSSIYDSFYLRRYKYASSGSTSNSFDFDTDPGLMNQEEPELAPFNPQVRSKGYVPPTSFDEDSAMPFGEILDAPMN